MIRVGDAQLLPELLQKSVLRRLSYKDRLAFASAFPDLVCHVDASFGHESLHLPNDESKILDGLGRGEEFVTAVRRMVDNGATVTEMDFRYGKGALVDALYELLGRPTTQASLTKLAAEPDCIGRPLFPYIFACTGLRELRLVEISPEPAEVPGFLSLRHLEHLDMCTSESVMPADLPLEDLLTLRLDFEWFDFDESVELRQEWFKALPPMPKLTHLSIFCMRIGMTTFPWDRLPALQELEFKHGGLGAHLLRGATLPLLRRLAWEDDEDVRVPALLRALGPTTASRLHHLQLHLCGSPVELKQSFKAMKQLRYLDRLELTLDWEKEDTGEYSVAANIMRGLLRHLKGLRHLEIITDPYASGSHPKDESIVVDFFLMTTSAPPPNLTFLKVYKSMFYSRTGPMRNGAWNVLRAIGDVLAHARRPSGLALTVCLPQHLVAQYKKKLGESKDFAAVTDLCHWEPA